MPNRVVEQFDDLIQQIEANLERLRAVRDLFAADPNFVASVQDILLDPNSNRRIDPVRATSARDPDKTQHERIRDYLLAKGNKGLTVTEIVAGTGINQNSVRAILYTAHAAEFDSSPQPGTRRHVWRVIEHAGLPTAQTKEVTPVKPRPKFGLHG
ncbi:MAG: hypothetical protein K2P78_07940 [Gemmataceae bacterium]|nr:hypothetical protein [Gemmataceae bacterium]